MKFTIEDLSPIERKIKVVVPAKTVAERYNKVCNKIKASAKMDGFRKGKAPKHLIARKYKKDIQSEILPSLIQDSIREAIFQNKLEAIGSPIIDKIKDIDEKKDYEYEAIIEVFPKIENIDFKGIKLEKTIYKCGEEEITNQLQAVQKSLAKMEVLPDDQKAEKDNSVKIDYNCFENGKEVDVLTSQPKKDYILKLGQLLISEDFDKNIIGMKKGDEKKFKIIIPETFYNEKFRNKEIEFEVILKEIREEILPEINDEMAKQTGEFKTLEELKERIKKNLQEGYDKRSEQEMNEQIYQALMKNTKFETPKALIKYELDLIIEEAKKMFESYNMSFEKAGQSEEQIREKYQDAAKEKAQRHLILGALAKQEKMQAEEKDYDDSYEKMSKNYQATTEQVKEVYNKNESQKQSLTDLILEEKAIKLVLENAEVIEVEPIKEVLDKK